MDRLLSYQKVHDYLKSLQTRHVKLKDFCGTSLEELQNRMASVEGFLSPGMVFFLYRSKLEGNHQRTFNVRTISFSILYSGIKADDYAGQRNAVTNAELIGLEVLSRIYIDSKTDSIGWLHNNFLKESVVMEEVDGTGVDTFYGMDFHFDLKVSEPLVVDPTQWNDGEVICTE